MSFAVWPLGTGDATCYRCRTGCATFELAIAQIDDELHALRFTRCERCDPRTADGVDLHRTADGV